MQLRGQRAATLLVYLNDDYEGGETDFPRINFRFKGGLGDALIFSNIDPAGAPDYDTVHAGLPPTTGEKWLFCNGFGRGRWSRQARVLQRSD